MRPPNGIRVQRYTSSHTQEFRQVAAPTVRTSFGQLRIWELFDIPKTAIEHWGRSVFWIENDNGDFLWLKGADRLFQDPGDVVIAVVKQEAILVGPDDTNPLFLNPGVWGIAHASVGDSNSHRGGLDAA